MAGCATQDVSWAVHWLASRFPARWSPLRVASGPPGVAPAAPSVGARARRARARRVAVDNLRRVLDHVSIQCADVASSAQFYDAVLDVLGGGRVMDFGTVIGYGTAGHASFWLSPLSAAVVLGELHIAFRADDRATVRRFFDAALVAGAEVLHRPRLFPEYDAHYYGAFVRDPDGNNVEAVCRAPQ